MATPRKPPHALRKEITGAIKRPHFACRLRTDYWQFLRDECKRLNCSQGVLIELLLKAQDRDGVIKLQDVFEYDSEERRIDVCGPD